jgi:hypothetical protein
LGKTEKFSNIKHNYYAIFYVHRDLEFYTSAGEVALGRWWFGGGLYLPANPFFHVFLHITHSARKFWKMENLIVNFDIFTGHRKYNGDEKHE